MIPFKIAKIRLRLKTKKKKLLWLKNLEVEAVVSAVSPVRTLTYTSRNKNDFLNKPLLL